VASGRWSVARGKGPGVLLVLLAPSLRLAGIRFGSAIRPQGYR
jgi:hypothetical protein